MAWYLGRGPLTGLGSWLGQCGGVRPATYVTWSGRDPVGSGLVRVVRRFEASRQLVALGLEWRVGVRGGVTVDGGRSTVDGDGDGDGLDCLDCLWTVVDGLGRQLTVLNGPGRWCTVVYSVVQCCAGGGARRGSRGLLQCPQGLTGLLQCPRGRWGAATVPTGAHRAATVPTGAGPGPIGAYRAATGIHRGATGALQ